VNQLKSQFRTWFKNDLLTVVSRLARRHVVLLPAEADSDDKIFPLQVPYRVEEQTLTVHLKGQEVGQLMVMLFTYEQHFPTKLLWTSTRRAYSGPCTLTFNLQNGTVTLADQAWGQIPLPLPARRFCLRFSFSAVSGQNRERLTGHYLLVSNQAVEEQYFHGDNYVDYDAQSVSVHSEVLHLARQYGIQSPVLEVGCATGGLLAALDAIGLSAVGLDKSEWAIQQVVRRLGIDRAWRCDVEREPFPEALLQRHPFRTLVLWSVFEHFSEPFAALTKLTSLCTKGTTLLLDTTNAQSLMHTLFGSQWEGYFDWTHHGIEQVSVQSLREMLPQLGWRIEHLVTRHIWDGSTDPTHALWREWWDADARFRRFVVERDVGDFITCVAVKI